MKLLRTAKENSPTVQLINSQIDATRNNVINTITNIKQSVGIALKDLKAQENKFLSRIYRLLGIYSSLTFVLIYYHL